MDQGNAWRSYLGPVHIIWGTRDKPPFQGNFIQRLYVKIIKYANHPELSSSFPRSFDHSGFSRVNFHVFNMNFCLK